MEAHFKEPVAHHMLYEAERVNSHQLHGVGVSIPPQISVHGILCQLYL